MKSLMFIIFLSGIVNIAQAQQEKVQPCKHSEVIQAQAIQKSRGENKWGLFKKKMGKRRMMRCPDFAKKRGNSQQAGYIVLKNNSAFAIEVMIDGVYHGYIEPGKEGIADKQSNQIKIMCLSENDSYEWIASANDKCDYIFSIAAP